MDAGVPRRGTINVVGATIEDEPDYDRTRLVLGVGQRVPLLEVAVNTELVHGTHYCVVTTAGSITVTLPASPSNGDSYEVINLDADSITVDGNGHDIAIAGGETDLLEQNDARIYRFANASGVWVAV